MELLIIAILVGGAIYWVITSLQKGRDLFWQLMMDTNAKHGTAFPTSPDGMHLVLSKGGAARAMVFDEKNRKLFLVTDAAKCKGEVLDFDYLRTWQLKWIVKDFKGSPLHENVHFAFGTSDIKRPLIEIPLRGIAHGNEWDKRLDVLLKG